MAALRLQHPRVWMIIGALFVAASALVHFQLSEIGALEPVGIWVWPLSIAGFAIADATVVRVHVRSETTGFSFLELPLFLGAILLAPATVWLTMTIGVAISVVVVQRITPMKALFNIANLSFQGALGLWVFHTLLGSADPIGPAGWLVAAIAALTSSAIATCFLLAVLTLVQGPEAMSGARYTVFMSWLTGSTNVSLALLAANLIDNQPISLVLLILPTTVLFGAYRAYTSERSQRDRVQAMHELALEVRSVRDQHAIVPVLRRVAAYLGAHRATLVLFPDQSSNGHAMRFSIAGEHAKVSQVVSGELASVIDEVHNLSTPQLRESTESQGVEVAGPVRGAGRSLGLLVVSDRLRDASEFSEDDLEMFKTILEQLGLTFEKNELGKEVTRLETRRQELQHEASHDVLTGVANRSLFASRLAEQLEAERSPSLLYLDLDDFKRINDHYGHGVGDQVLIEIADRFASAVGPNDCVARIGGDEFAVLLSDSANDVKIAETLLDLASQPVQTAAGPVWAHASIGLARADTSSDPGSLLRNADVAMYDAKAQGKGKLILA